jgi:hypothetical protein
MRIIRKTCLVAAMLACASASAAQDWRSYFNGTYECEEFGAGVVDLIMRYDFATDRLYTRQLNALGEWLPEESSKSYASISGNEFLATGSSHTTALRVFFDIVNEVPGDLTPSYLRFQEDAGAHDTTIETPCKKTL